MSAQQLARTGENTHCVDCYAKPLFGGMRCLPCFQKRVKDKLVLHGCGIHPPSAWCYSDCGCRCEGCRRGKSIKKAAEVRR